MRLTERDLELLRWINGHGFVTARQAADWMGTCLQAGHRRMGLLHEGGYVTRQRLFHGAERAYWLSALGQQVSGDTLSCPETISPATYRHHWMMVDLAHDLITKTKGQFTPEHRLREQRAIKGVGAEGHVPDGLLKVKSKKPIAIELELTLKGRERLEGIVEGYLDRDLSAVWYFVTSDQIRRRLTSIIDGERLFKIKPWQPRS